MRYALQVFEIGNEIKFCNALHTFISVLYSTRANHVLDNSFLLTPVAETSLTQPLTFSQPEGLSVIEMTAVGVDYVETPIAFTCLRQQCPT